ncbi:MAG TPA: MMPL family transporter [Acidisoma sp.]|jgi:predicted exporter|uniref:MMPL family transporter n=1 Tax=Acidisoma sp. TaxID=1872115 RepID=UPI002CEF62E6|nr:MMPL family transporter [Acidisoma sp.]HTH99635.1 MMPL family transporter [Acidisoma sp.]
MVRSWLPVWLCLLLALLCAGIAARSHYRTDMGDFLPHAHSLAQQALDAQVSSGGASRILMLSIEGAPPAALAQLSLGLGARLRRNPAFVAVLNGDDAAMAGVQAFVWGHRYLLSADSTPALFTVAGLRAALQNDLTLLASDFGAAAAQSLPADPTGAALSLAQQLDAAAGHGPETQDGAWFSPDGRSALLLLRTAAPGFDIDAQAKVLALIRQDFASLRAAVPGAQQARLRESGPGVFAVDTRDVTKRDVSRLSILATAGAVLFLLIAYRSPRVLLLGLLPVACGALAATAAVSLAFGFVHAITLGFGVTLIGEAMDYSIYLLTQTLKGDRADRTLARIWPTLRLGALTSIAGFCTMLLSDFTGFAQLGLFSVAGLLGAAGVTRFVLPVLVPDGFFASGAAGIGAPLRLLLRWQQPARSVLVVLLAAAVIALAAHRGPIWDDNLLNLSPLSPATQALDQRLRHDLGVPDTRYFIAYRAPSMDQALETSEQMQTVLAPLVTEKIIGGYDLPSLVLPSDRTQRARLDALPDDATLHAAFMQAISGLPFRPDSFVPFFKDVARARAGGLLTEASLPALLSLRLQSMLMPSGHGWTVLAPLQNVADAARLDASLKAALPAGAVLVDLDRQSTDLLHTFQREAVTLAVAGSLAILVLLFVGLHSPRRVLAVAGPVGAAVILTAAILTLGGKLSIFMVAGFLLIVALGSNYCLFFARGDQAPEERARALASIMLANLCTVAAYGLLSLSHIPVLHDIGLTVAIGTFLCLVCGAAFSAPAADRRG